MALIGEVLEVIDVVSEPEIPIGPADVPTPSHQASPVPADVEDSRPEPARMRLQA